MKLTIVGSGTCVPTISRGSPANYLEIGKIKALVDCGPGTVRQLVKAKLDYKDIDLVCFTHFHPDHTLDLTALMHALNWTPEFDRKKDLTLVGPVGLKSFFDRYMRLVEGLMPRPKTYKIIIKEIKKKLEFDNFTIECDKTIHSATSHAYKFTEKGKTLVISGDCDYDEGLITFVRNVDLLLLECSYANNMKMRGHLVPQECGMIAKKAGVKKLVLTHLYPVSPDLRLKQVKKIFPDTIQAEDFMKLEV